MLSLFFNQIIADVEIGAAPANIEAYRTKNMARTVTILLPTRGTAFFNP